MVEKIKVDDKYEVIVNQESNKFEFKALRYGQEWRNLIGDNLVLAMFYRIQELEEENNKLKK